VSDPFDQIFVGQQLLAKIEQASCELRFGGGEGLLRFGLRGVYDRAGRQHERHRAHRAVRVGVELAPHAARVVGDDSADRARIAAGWVGTDPASMQCEEPVGVSENRAGASSQRSAVILERHPVPVPASVDQDIVALGLAAQARSGSAERRVPAGLAAVFEDRDNVGDVAGGDHHLRDQPVRTGVGRVPDEVDRAAVHLLLADQGA